MNEEERSTIRAHLGARVVGSIFRKEVVQVLAHRHARREGGQRHREELLAFEGCKGLEMQWSGRKQTECRAKMQKVGAKGNGRGGVRPSAGLNRTQG